MAIKTGRPGTARVAHRAMWADPLWQPNMYAPKAENPAKPTLHPSEPSGEPIAHIALPNGAAYPVYPPARERLGFRR